MCSELEEYINEFIDSIKSNLRVKLLKTKKGVELYVTPNNASSDKPSEWSTIKMCSGFEKDLISLAFKIALARAYNLRILILDEIDSAATSENSGRLFSLIAKITDFDSVIVVSHKDSVRNVLVEEGQNVVAYEVTNGNYELIG
jgi:DNA repair exonuclease SbcCD ATPase subunit